MPENAWVLNDSIPTGIAQQFATPVAPWMRTYWTPAELAFNAQAVSALFSYYQQYYLHLVAR